MTTRKPADDLSKLGHEIKVTMAREGIIKGEVRIMTSQNEWAPAYFIECPSHALFMEVLRAILPRPK